MIQPRLTPRLDLLLRRSVADLRDRIAGALNRPTREDRLADRMRLVGACALGLLAAGFSILAVFVVLNLIFHFIPS